MSEVETRELLAAARKASEQARSTHKTMTAAAAARTDAAHVAMEAGLPWSRSRRPQICTRTGCDRNTGQASH